ncbi:E3 ubiquitin-protein ligase pub1 [Yamadazyma tenuis]|uniref:RNA-binding domain-containing protein n=1 Tax=Candida tenuis (strain ATCC 10573 / BCRC 21748 / CBS 615 / JCM 9827 / NBRC 10315 / NRRL Y-1498 / VKM Y-70) TaxID=590646 RepID=G3BBX3_CANTC|nr:RNA-binding domain-containing protein [Yamadazyma tenuis ATCC 10573]EGV60103.1 RNA-binding domain-containing protein [Yamadazyma tenuis ATCC 10573]WEJ94663.1 E3 ubiquitin-protein ligase pub1 [Yamadazyma tenuis]
MSTPSIPPSSDTRNPTDSTHPTSTGGDAAGATSVPVASAVHGGRQVSNRILYVAGLDKSIDEAELSKVFGQYGSIKLIKILGDKNKLGFNYAFIEFQEPNSASDALSGLNGKNINDHIIVIKWAYHSSNANSVQSAEPVFNVFVGDLSPEVDDVTLSKAFSQFKSKREAHVMWDMQTSRSRGYGFVTFLDQLDAQMAINSMNGQEVLGRVIRCNWASHKQKPQQPFKKTTPLRTSQPLAHSPILQLPAPEQFSPGQFGSVPFSPVSGQLAQFPNTLGPIHPHAHHPHQVMQMQMPMKAHRISSQVSGPPLHMVGGGTRGPTSSLMSSGMELEPLDEFVRNGSGASAGSGANTTLSGPNDVDMGLEMPLVSPQSYEIVLRQTPAWQTTVYLGNIAHFTRQEELIPLIQGFGYIVDLKFHPEKGCAFVKYDSHERAAMTIVQLAGFNLNGRPLKCGWGKDRPPGPYRNVSQNFIQRP